MFPFEMFPMSRHTEPVWNLVATFDVPEPVVFGIPEVAKNVLRGATGLVVPTPTFPEPATNSAVVPEVVWALNTLPAPNCLTVSAFAEAALPVNRT